MASRGQHYGFQAATTVQPANGGHAYLFGNNGSENDLSEDDGETFELRSRGRDRLRRSASRERMDDIIYLARDVQEGDTLNSLALHYHCSVGSVITSVQRYVMYCRALCLRFSHFIYCHCSFILHCGIIHLQSTISIVDLVSSWDVQTRF